MVLETCYNTPGLLHWCGMSKLKDVFGANLSYWMKNGGRKQKWLAEQLGVTEPVVSRWKSGESFPKNADHIELLAELMSVPVWILFVEDGVKDPLEAIKHVSDQLKKKLAFNGSDVVSQDQRYQRKSPKMSRKPKAT